MTQHPAPPTRQADPPASRTVTTLQRVLLAGLLIAAAALGLWYAADGSTEPRAPGRHVVLVILDTTRWDDLGCYGNPRHPTPNIDAIAAEGVRFDQAISASGWTLPAVASLLTGTWPTLHGAWGQNMKVTGIRENLPTVADELKFHGFNTLAFVNATFLSPLLDVDRGFDVYDHTYAYNNRIRRADETIDLALDSIRKHADESNFVYIHLFDPHLDYDPPVGYQWKHTSGRSTPSPPLSMKGCKDLQTGGGQDPPPPADIEYVKGVHLGEVDFADAQVGRLVAELKKLGIYDRTTLIVTADHGEEFWEHRGFEHGHTLYDELVRVPLILKLPADVAVSRHVVEAQVPVLDVMPTVFDLLGLAKPESFVGQSLLPLIRGESGEDRPVFCERTLYGPEQMAVRRSRYKYIQTLHETGPPDEELYDWRNDPAETANLIGREPDIAAALRAELEAFRQDIEKQAAAMPPPKRINMSSPAVREFQRSLESMGYVKKTR